MSITFHQKTRHQSKLLEESFFDMAILDFMHWDCSTCEDNNERAVASSSIEASFSIIFYDITLYHIIRHHIIIISHSSITYHTVSYHITAEGVMLYHILSYRILSYHFRSMHHSPWWAASIHIKYSQHHRESNYSPSWYIRMGWWTVSG